MTVRDYVYLLWPEVQVSGFNAMGNPYVIGAPGPTALAGWGHALERMLQGRDNRSHSPGWPLNVAGAALIVHHTDFDEGRPLFPAQFNEKGHRDVAIEGGTPSMVEEIKGHGRFSLIAALAPQAGADDDDVEEAREWLHRETSRALVDWASRAGLSGGATFPSGAAELFEGVEGEGTNMPARLASLGGAALTDRSDVLEGEGNDDSGDTLERLLDALAIVNDSETEAGRAPPYRRQPGWLVPYPAGFKAIESPKSRRNAVQRHPHVYAEPLLGLGEYLSVSRLVGNHGERLLEAFWQYEPEEGAYAVRPLQMRE